jgi:NQR2, RnfD, RnfE family
MKREVSAVRRRIRNFSKTPKGLVTIILIIFLAMAAPGQGFRAVMKGLLSAAIAAGLVDLIILRARKKVWEFPSGAVLTAIIVAMVLRAQEPWYVTTITSVAAVLSKYLFRTRSANVFSPAALAIIASFYVFHTGQSWSGALTDVLPVAKVALLGGRSVHRGPGQQAAAGADISGSLFSAVHGHGLRRQSTNGGRNIPDSRRRGRAVLRLHHPDRSADIAGKVSRPDRLGLIVAVVSFAFFEWAGVVYYLLAGVLAGNVWEAWRRSTRRSGMTFPRGLGAFLQEISPWKTSSTIF